MNDNFDYLVLFDTDRIQEYIFATLKLKEIRGASQLLDNLNREQTSSLIEQFGGKDIYIGGGAGAVKFFSMEKAQGFCKALEALYRDQTLVASISTWIEPREQGETFPIWIERAEKNLARHKESRGKYIPVISNPYFKVCDLCGRLPATNRRSAAEPTTYVCLACRRRSEEDKAPNRSIVYETIESLVPEVTIQWPEEMTKIGELSKPRGYIGLIYADGNRMGKLKREVLKDTPTEETYKKFSRCIDKATRYAIITAILDILGQPQKGETYPVQFFISGGDDLLLTLPAHQALPVTLKFCEYFEDFFCNGIITKDGREILPSMAKEASMAVGVAIAKDSYPLFSLIQTGHELQASAKKRAWAEWQERGLNTSFIDFMATSGTLLEPIQVQRQKEMHLEEEKTDLTLRPYTTQDLQKLLDFIRGLKSNQFPRNKMIEMSQCLYEGRFQACLDFLVLLSRLPQNKPGQAPKQALLESVPQFDLLFLPWRKEKDGRFTTPILDMVELYDYVD